MVPIRTHLAAFCSGLLLSAAPASALERLVIEIPGLDTSISINLGEAESADTLIEASSDLRDLDDFSGGRLRGLLERIFLAPLPCLLYTSPSPRD